MKKEIFNYEEGIKELETIVNKLSQGKVSLDESLELYKRGVDLSNKCSARLKEVEQTIKILDVDTNQESDFVISEDE